MKYIVFHIIEYTSQKQYDICSENDMYCEVEYSNNTYSTKVIKNKNKAGWNEMIVCPHNDTCSYFTIRIYDKDALYQKTLIYTKTFFLKSQYNHSYIKHDEDGLHFFYTLSELDPLDKYKHKIKSLENHYTLEIEKLRLKTNQLQTDLCMNRSIINQINTIIKNK
jgi:hypothetical protein